ncbi:MAG: hypothetical protein FWE32_11550 [Oscillospiraceae bacterium]|nr:hypothetical protein [Oscillospiraceae bacterium]
MTESATTAILDGLRKMEVLVSALIKLLESEMPKAKTTVKELRRLAVLEEVFRTNGVATPDELSRYAKKYGKTPSSCAGYFSGKAPSLIASNDRKLRLLTEKGKEYVAGARASWGDDWLERVPLDTVGSAHIDDLLEVCF